MNPTKLKEEIERLRKQNNELVGDNLALTNQLIDIKQQEKARVIKIIDECFIGFDEGEFQFIKEELKSQIEKEKDE